jgi:hypothetical protein
VIYSAANCRAFEVAKSADSTFFANHPEASHYHRPLFPGEPPDLPLPGTAIVSVLKMLPELHVRIVHYFKPDDTVSRFIFMDWIGA